MAPKFPLDGKRLRNSQIWQICKEHPFVTRGAINLWIEANDAKPVGKMKDDEFALASAADVTIEDFRAHRDLYLHGFVADGKGWLLHPVIMEVAARKPARQAKRKTEEYTEDFNSIWVAFQCGDNCPGASKLLAWEAYRGIAEPRPTDAQLRGLVQTYLSQCRARKSTVCHPTTFFNQRRWEGLTGVSTPDPFLDSARAMQAWGGLAKPFVEEIGVAPFMAYFKGTSVRKGPPFTIKVEKEVVKRLIEKKFSSQLMSKFGHFLIEVAA